MTQDLDLPTPEITPVPKRFWANVSVVWVVPILALIVSLGGRARFINRTGLL